MPPSEKINIVFVHGYSVTNLNTYGELPVRLKAEAANNAMDVNVEEIHLGRYISFRDEVKLNDISRAFESAVKDQLSHLLNKKERFVCITHSTGGPVIRNWWSRYYFGKDKTCPMSHLIMLAPANFGSALAQLGKSRVSRIISWVEGVEPGQGILDWLELGSWPAWVLNREWAEASDDLIGPAGIFPFVLTGQSIDRKIYDNLNSYTGEMGSDGVVRVAAANLNTKYIRLVQGPDKTGLGKITLMEEKESHATAFRIISKKSHSGDKMGILASVKKEISDTESAETIKAIFDCIGVNTKPEYDSLVNRFNNETIEVQKDELEEPVKKGILGERTFIHNRFSQVIFKIFDSEGMPVTDYDLLFTGPGNNPNHLPEGFFADRQQNRVDRNTVTYFFNYDVMTGADINGKDLRPVHSRPIMLGLKVNPRPADGFVRFVPCKLEASREFLDIALQANCTTMLEIRLQRLVDKEVFRMKKLEGNAMPSTKEGDFKRTSPGKETVD